MEVEYTVVFNKIPSEDGSKQIVSEDEAEGPGQFTDNLTVRRNHPSFY